MEQLVTTKVNALKRMLDNAITQGGNVKRAWSTWFSPAQRAQPANDSSFARPPRTSAPKSGRASAKKGAKPSGILLILRSWCQNVRAGKNGAEARRYWGSGYFYPIGPGVKTLTPPQVAAR
jgi:hypothetical protein